MAIPKHHMAIKGDECQCGRRASLRHCIRCGSSRVYSRLNQWHTHMDGTTKPVPSQYRCQTCSMLFIESEREWCLAPPVGTMLAAQQIKAIHEAGTTGEYQRPEDIKIAKALKELIPDKDPTPQESFRRMVYRKKQEYLALAEVSDTSTTELTMLEFLEKWIKDEGILIPEGESLT